MTSSFVCSECNKSYKHLGALHSHMKWCNYNPSLECEFCSKTFASKYSLERHMNTCKQKQNNVHISNSHSHSHNNNHNHNNSHNVNAETVNIYNNITYHADLSDKNLYRLLYSKLRPQYLKDGEEGFYNFIQYELFSDPLDCKKTAIVCTNYKEERFIYGFINEEGKPELKEDISLKSFDRQLSKFDKIMEGIVRDYEPTKLNCMSVDPLKTAERVYNLVQSITQRPNMSSSMAQRVRTKEKQPLTESEFEQMNREVQEELKQKGQHIHQLYKELTLEERLLKNEILGQRMLEQEREQRREILEEQKEQKQQQQEQQEQEKEAVQKKNLSVKQKRIKTKSKNKNDDLLYN
jgi:hypothetical protein